jgi:excisionase family DNA binding protein
MTQEPAHAPEWLTVSEVAAQLRVDDGTVRRWIKTQQLPALYLGSTKVGYRIRRADLDAFIARRLGQAARPAGG